MSEGEKIIKINIEEQMKSAYIDYSMSVIVSRALPDVRDGMKPVHRRVLFGMHKLGLSSNRKFKKSAAIVGEVLGKYHPHGDSSVYMAMVRMAQEWSLRYPLVNGQGNYGSIDGDSPAAMRYTEAKLNKISDDILGDLDKNTVDHQPNFDESKQEPTVLPTKVPVLLINGASGIAVGMATNMAPHNLTNVIDATVAYVDDNEVSTDTLIDAIQAPDFPTGGTIYGYAGVREAYETGRGRVVLRGKSEIETTSTGREKIIITEIPYLVNKAELIKKIAELVQDKKIEGISNVNDESDRNGMRIVVDIKRDAISSVVLNKLYKFTALQNSFSINNIALVNGRPRLLNLREIIHYFVEHRHDVVVRRTQYDLDVAEARAHIVEGLIIASDNIDRVIKIIRGASDPETAKAELIAEFKLTDIQSQQIVDMRLRRLTGLEQDKLRAEYDELVEKITRFKEILGSKEIRMGIIKDELLEIKAKYGDERRTDMVPDAGEFNPEDFYADDEMVITISHLGYIKRTPLSEFRVQGRGGVGARGSSTREEDFLEHLFVTTMHNTLLLFTEKGKCFWLKVYDIPEGAKNSKGRAIQNLLNIDKDDKVLTYINTKSLKDVDYINSHNIVLSTKRGVVKKTSLEAYSRPRTNGVNAINIREDDQLLEAKLTNGSNEIMLAQNAGKAIRFNESNVRAVGRTSTGVRGISLSDSEKVVGMICIESPEQEVLVVSANGYGKRSNIEDYRVTNRGGKGVKTINVTDKTGELISIKTVTDRDDLMIITENGVTIRLTVAEIRQTGRNAQGVKLMNLREGDSIASVARIEAIDEEVVADTASEEVVAEEVVVETTPEEVATEEVVVETTPEEVATEEVKEIEVEEVADVEESTILEEDGQQKFDI